MCVYVHMCESIVSCSLLSPQGDFEFDGAVGVGVEGAVGEGEGVEGGANLLLVGGVVVMLFLLWWACRRQRKRPRGRRLLIAKFPIV